MGRTRLEQRLGATPEELAASRWDTLAGLGFSHLVMYFIILATASTLFRAGIHEVNSDADAAEALRPVAGEAAGALFALGLVGVGALAVPVMTTGAAYDLCQALGWRHGLYAKPREATKFYLTIAAFTALAVGLNFLGFNPMKALVWSGIVQGFSTPPLLLLIMLMTGSRAVMGEHTNSRGMKVLGWATTLVTFAATAGLVVTWVM